MHRNNEFKTASGSGVTFGASDKSTKLLFSDGTNIVDTNFSGATDLDGGVLTLDADGDTTITADTDDQIDIAIAGADDFRFPTRYSFLNYFSCGFQPSLF